MKKSKGPPSKKAPPLKTPHPKMLKIQKAPGEFLEEIRYYHPIGPCTISRRALLTCTITRRVLIRMLKHSYISWAYVVVQCINKRRKLLIVAN